MKSPGIEVSEEGTSALDEEDQTSRYPSQGERSISSASDYVTEHDHFREPVSEHPTTMDSISSFLETMHSKNLTLKKLVKVQQQRIDELARENMALRKASEMKDEEISKTMAYLNMIRDVAGDVDLSNGEAALNESESPSEVRISSRDEPSGMPKDSGAPSNRARLPKKTSTVDRRKTSFIVSHKVAVKRVMHFMRKINGAYNRRSVGLYFFACCFAQAALPQLLGISSVATPIVYVPLP